MSVLLESRRRMIRAKGDMMTLKRLTSTTTSSDVSLLGFLALFHADQIGVGGVQQGDARLAILNDEILEQSWPGPPRSGDLVIIDGRPSRVIASTEVTDGELVIGHNLWVRGS